MVVSMGMAFHPRLPDRPNIPCLADHWVGLGEIRHNKFAIFFPNFSAINLRNGVVSLRKLEIIFKYSISLF
jgi:hypothetical protein